MEKEVNFGKLLHGGDYNPEQWYRLLRRKSEAVGGKTALDDGKIPGGAPCQCSERTESVRGAP